jgi:preprotein translocase subunit SecG
MVRFSNIVEYRFIADFDALIFEATKNLRCFASAAGFLYEARSERVRAMQSVLLIVLLITTIAMIIVILLQRSEGGALGMGGSGGGIGNFFTPRGAGDALSRTTAILAIVFFLTSLSLTLLAVHGRPEQSFLQSAPLNSGHVTLPATHAPQVPSVPSPH